MIRLVSIYDERADDGWAMRHGAAEVLYRLLKERPPEANISHRELPSFEDHVRFLMSRPYQHWYLIEAQWSRGEPHYESGWEPVGAIGATKQNEIAIAILAEHQRKGYASAALTQFTIDHRPAPALPSQRVGYWIANVAPANARSHALFGGLGWIPVQTTYRHP